MRELNKINYFTETKTLFFVQGVRGKKINKKKHDSARKRENLNFNSHEWDTKHHLILNAIEKQTAQQHLGARDKSVQKPSSSNGSGETGIF